MKHDYITQIQHKIDAHRQTIEALQREIDKLEGAAEVIAQLRGNDGVLALDVTPEKKSSGPLYTIRKRAAPVGERLSSKGMDKQAKAALTVHADGLTMKDLGGAIGLQPGDKKAANRLWYAMDVAIKAGKFVKEDGLYKLPPKPQSATTEDADAA